MSLRKVLAFISINEEDVEKDIRSSGPIDYLESVVDNLSDNGVFLDSAFIIDDYEDDTWHRYINYLSDWVFEHQVEGEEKISPKSFEEWIKEDVV